MKRRARSSVATPSSPVRIDRAEDAPRSGALAGVAVLELGQIYNGPYCALLLAHHGADVIKIEPPQGDMLRRMDRSPGGASYPFLMLNANKRSVCIDLKQPRGRELLLQLAERGVIREVEVAVRSRVKVLGTPIKLGASPEAAPTPPPRLGADTETVLRNFLGLDAPHLADLRREGVI